jgi:hypothetical protein
VAVCVGVLILVPLASLVALRSRQQASVTRLIEGYNLAAEPWPYSAQPEDPDHVLVVPQAVDIRDRPRTPGVRALAADYMVVDLNDACAAMSLTMRLKYASGPSYLTRDVAVNLRSAREPGNVRLFVPVYQSLDASRNPDLEIRFAGLEFPVRDVPCLAGLRRVPESAVAPLWIDLDLDGDWRERPLYETFESEPVLEDPGPARYVSHAGLEIRGVGTLHGVPRDFVSQSKVASLHHAGGVVVDGIAEGPFGYLVASEPRTLTAGTQLVCHGELFEGGLTFGVLKNGLWDQYFNITTPGSFVAAVEVPAAGTYVAVIANDNQDLTKPTKFVITGMDWIAR